MRSCTCCIRLLIAVGLLCLVAGWPLPGVAKTLEIGSPAPDFDLPGVDGKQYRLADYADAKVLVVVFTCNHCPTAQAYEERIKRLAADYKDRGVALVAISPNDPEALRTEELSYTDVGDSFEDMKIRAKDHAFNFPYLYDGDSQKVSRAYGPVSTPHVFVFDQARKLRFVGRIDNSDKIERATTRETRDAVEALLAGRPVPVEKTKTFGCSIKWSDKRASVAASQKRLAAQEATLETIDLDGVRRLVRNEGKKLLLVDVWATWCGPCIVDLPEYAAIHQTYRNRDFELATISADAPEAEDKVLELLRNHQVAGKNYLFTGDDKYALMDAVDKESVGPVPYTILIAPGGKVLYRHSGPCEPLEIRKAIVDYLGRTYK